MDASVQKVSVSQSPQKQRARRMLELALPGTTTPNRSSKLTW